MPFSSSAEGPTPEAASAQGSGSAPGSDEKNAQEGSFECNICLDTAKDAVVSYCGHLFW